MKLYDLIKEFTKSKENSNYFSSSNKSKNLFSTYFSTNVRSSETLIKYLENIKPDIGLERKSWRKQSNHNQEVSKQYIAPLLSSELIFSGERNTYNYTKKAEIINNLFKLDLTSSEKLIISSLFTSNYRLIGNRSIAEEVLEIIEILRENNVKEEEIEKDILQVLLSENEYKFMENKLYLLMIFYNEYSSEEGNIFSIILGLTDIEIKEYYDLIYDELSSQNYDSPLSKRLKSGGNLTKSTIENMFLLFYIILQIQKGADYLEILNNIFSGLDKYGEIDSEKIINNLCTNDCKNILAKAFEDINSNLSIEYDYYSVEELDPSTKTSKISDESIFQSLKKTALEKSSYCCALESLRGCSSHYFTSRSTNQNFLELHHFLPRKYRAYIDNGVEFIENYIPLCPSCHRMIHNAVDNERKIILRYILNANEILKEKLDNTEIVNCKNLYEKLEVIYDFEKNN